MWANKTMAAKLGIDCPGLLEADRCDDVRWKELTHQGNHAFGRGNFEEASDLYAAALQEAVKLFERALQGDQIEAVPILVISHHNAAENWQALDKPDKAVQHFRAVYDRIVGIAESDAAPFPLRTACVRDLSHVMSPLISALSETGASEKTIAQLVTRARRIALDLPNPSPEETRH